MLRLSVCLFVLSLASLLSSSAHADEIPRTQIHPYTLGITKVNITFLEAAGASAASLHFINVHQNENTSVVAAKALMYFVGGSITLLQHGGTRLVSFQTEAGGPTFTFDPNRMFTPVGVEATLKGNGPFTAKAKEAVIDFGKQLLKIYRFEEQKIAIALHNNGPHYSAKDYLPGGEYAKDAEKVFIAPNSEPRNFAFVTQEFLYQRLVNEGLNAVLQQTKTAPTDDGSLSVYAYMQNKPYVNIEAAAADDSEGGRVILQLDMLNRMKKALGL